VPEKAVARCIFRSNPDACPDDLCHGGDWTLCGVWIGDDWADDEEFDDAGPATEQGAAEGEGAGS
jgi:hypothetical protein